MTLKFCYELYGDEMNTYIKTLQFQHKYDRYLQQAYPAKIKVGTIEDKEKMRDFYKYLNMLKDNFDTYQHFYRGPVEDGEEPFSIAQHLQGLRKFGIATFPNVRSIKLGCQISDEDIKAFAMAFPNLLGLKTPFSTSGRYMRLQKHLWVLIMPGTRGDIRLENKYAEEICTELPLLEILDISEQSHLVLTKFKLPNLAQLEINVNTLHSVVTPVLNCIRLKVLTVRVPTPKDVMIAAHVLKSILRSESCRINFLTVNHELVELAHIWFMGLKYCISSYPGFCIEFLK